MLPPALQSIADELATWRARVLDEVGGLSEHQAAWRPPADSWSIREVLHHLVIAEGLGGRVSTATLRRAAERGPLAAYPQECEADVLAWDPPTADDRWPVEVPEPAVPTDREPLAALREALATQAQRTAAVLDRLAAIDPRAVTAAHPLLGEMNLAQWARFAAYHLRVHLRHIQDIKAAPGFPPG